MHKIYLLLLVFVAISCKHEEKQISYGFFMTKDACWKNMYANEYRYKQIESAVNVGKVRYGDSLVLAESKRYVMWRRNFIKEKTVENLFRYADSVETAFEKRDSWSHPPLAALKQRLLASNDSVDFYTLLYFATTGEKDLLDNMYAKLGSISDLFRPHIPTFKDKEVYQPSETVYVTMPTSVVYEGTLRLDFSRVTCRLKGTNTTIQPEVVQSGPYFLLMYNPTEVGEYAIEGEVNVLHEGIYPGYVRLKNSFVVEKAATQGYTTAQKTLEIKSASR